MKLKRLFAIFMVSITIASCSDVEAPRDPTAQPNVEVLFPSFVLPGLNRERKLRVYFPPGYAKSKKHYPVLYMHDGQNLFDDATAFAGEWGVDESLNALAESQGLELIVVGIDNGQEHRMNELSPWQNQEFGDAEGTHYLEFITDVVKPYIDTNYRTKPEPQHTAIMGSSMGGLFSHYAIHQRPDVFSKAGIFSPSYWFSEQVYGFTADNPVPNTVRMFFLVGTKEGTDMVANMEKMVTQQLEQSHPQANLKTKVVEGAEHNEAFWAEEFPEAVLWLYGAE